MENRVHVSGHKSAPAFVHVLPRETDTTAIPPSINGKTKKRKQRPTDVRTDRTTNARTNSFYDCDESLAKVQPTDNFRGRRDPSH